MQRVLLTAVLSLSVILLAASTAAAGGPAAKAWMTAGAAFTYQGRLTDGGVPANGLYDFKFGLFDAVSGGSQVGGPVTLDDVAVSGGLFTVQLDFGASAFTGDARYLQVAVRPGSSSGLYNLLSPRQPLTATPYALSLVPGAQISGPVPTGLSVTSTSGGTGVYGIGGVGVYGQSEGGSGVVGMATGATGATNGVLGGSASSSGSGVYGLNTNGGTGVYGTGGTGVYGQSYSWSGTGVYGYAAAATGSTNGVLGMAASPGGNGVSGLNTNGGYGVYGQGGTGVYGTGGYGVYGQSGLSSGRGVYGDATAASGTDYGVYGQSASSGGYGVYGTNTNGTGVAGYSSSGNGVYGNSTDGAGVSGFSTDGTGVVGATSTGFAMQAYGDATQNSSNGGWVKAMLLLNPSQPPYYMNDCFNSQATGSAVDTVPCGFSVTINGDGDYTIDFGFDVTTRFFSVTPYYFVNSQPTLAMITDALRNTLTIYVFDLNGDPRPTAVAYIIVY